MSVLAVHQANFLPWLGFFDKMSSSDLFYVLDHVQAPNGRDYFARTGICVNDSVHWLSVPIQRSGHAFQKHFDVKIADARFARKHLATIKQSYCKYPFFEQVYADLAVIYEYESDRLTDFCLNAIQLIRKRLAIHVPIVRTSALVLEHPHLQTLAGAELMLELTRLSGCSTYLSGNGARVYMKPELFAKAGLRLKFQDFAAPQFARSCVSGLSVIDTAMQIGWSGVIGLLTWM